ncbi:hypothetical protein VTI28DRAFT_10187 [Corynascus sepedonium]
MSGSSNITSSIAVLIHLGFPSRHASLTVQPWNRKKPPSSAAIAVGTCNVLKKSHKPRQIPGFFSVFLIVVSALPLHHVFTPRCETLGALSKVSARPEAGRGSRLTDASRTRLHSLIACSITCSAANATFILSKLALLGCFIRRDVLVDNVSAHLGVKMTPRFSKDPGCLY